MDATTPKVWNGVTGSFDQPAPPTVPRDFGKEIRQAEQDELRWLQRQL